jgi:hypothetical protein
MNRRTTIGFLGPLLVLTGLGITQVPLRFRWQDFYPEDVHKFPERERPVIDKIIFDLDQLRRNDNDPAGPLFAVEKTLNGLSSPGSENDPPTVVLDTHGSEIVFAHIFIEQPAGPPQEAFVTPKLKRTVTASGCGSTNDFTFFIAGGKLMASAPVCQASMSGGRTVHVMAFYKR